MVLDRLASRELQIARFERYGALLTEHQQQVLNLYLRQDWSISEIARTQETSRAAVHDLIRRSSQSLADYDARLGLLAADRERQSQHSALARELSRIRARLAGVELELSSGEL
ncbi:MAG: hypothetical protein M3072_09015 [Candidatus Dormibacteraeota bacterium]|nr:hypothetical protein [Candidatus Dormibacteraeota bacterium]